jgi:hypothetical protein
MRSLDGMTRLPLRLAETRTSRSPGAMVPGFRSFDEGLRHDECETSADWKSGGGPCSRHNPASGQREACGRTRVRRCASPLHTPLGRPAPANRSAHESGPSLRRLAGRLLCSYSRPTTRCGCTSLVLARHPQRGFSRGRATVLPGRIARAPSCAARGLTVERESELAGGW